ncbi:LON peptidase N-terminal domain and ring finger 1, like isoform X1 [Hypanus sabinus]|uniref:LON peptidase N-terminal domain and ring finger 1, like isoform X1 n=1 Tax=Hypanus sabinus TaxID=79690 RepID=UPI0028C444E2|nr:LON peptidase N-terminal domain and ring finger 1, like isoform X1 [Hypanus sabinus]
MLGSVRPPDGRDMSDTRSAGGVSSLASQGSSDDCDGGGTVATPAADRVAAERLWEVLKRCSVAGGRGALQLSGLVDYLLLGFKAGGLTPTAGCPAQAKGLLDCGRCRQTLVGPVTLRCGHTWCWRCLLWDPRCQLCGEETAAPGLQSQSLRSNVILSHLMAKWFPAQMSRVRDNLRLEELLAEGRHPEALALVEQLDLKPNDVVLLGYRAESYAGLQLFTEAMEDIEALSSRMPAWPEGYFRKARVLRSMGRVEEAIQSLLQCLALDENFTPAEVEMEKILSHLLTLGPENVKEGLLHSRNKALTVELSTAVGCCQILPYSTKLKNEQIPSSGKGEQVCLDQPELFQSPLSMRKTVGLQRVPSAPLFSSEKKAVNMKRKLSSSDQEIKDTIIWKNKHQKQNTEQLCDSFSESILRKDQIDVSDFECSLCMRLFLEPVTTPCGHSFCKGCLERSLDHSPMCPLCKDSLKEYLENRKFSVTCILKELIARYLPEELYERQKIHDEETAELTHLTKNVPIFVCTMAYPTVPCPLHVFEPRYRLMIRRCIDTGTKQFGMCINDPQHGFTDYGCMLHIRSIHFLPDGRSVVDTVGGSCFKVLERGQKDGYYTANIEYLKDVKVTGEELGELTDLHDKVYVQACNWFQNLKSRFRSQILQHFGSMPEKEEDIQGPLNGPAWCWWLLAVLPVDPRYQLSVLSMTSLKNRLIKIQNILIYFSSARYRPK